MNYRFIAADSLQKLIVLVILFLWSKVSSRGSLEWVITLFSLATLPNTLVMGIPLLGAMYGDCSGSLMVQIVVLQCIIWYTLLLFLFEYRGAKLLISEQFPDDTAALIESVEVDPDVMSFDGRDVLETKSEVHDNGKLHVKVSKSTSIRSGDFSSEHNSSDNISPTPSNMSDVEIYSLPSLNGVPSLNEIDGFYSFRRGSSMGFWNNKGSLRTTSNGDLGFNEEKESAGIDRVYSVGSRRSIGAQDVGYGAPASAATFSPSMGAISTVLEKKAKKKKVDNGGKDGSVDDGHRVNVDPQDYNNHGKDELNLDTKSHGNEPDIEGSMLSKHGSGSITITITEAQPEVVTQYEPKPTAMPPGSVMTKLVLMMIWRKLTRNPNTYSSLIGLAWSLISFRWHVEMPVIVANSIKILSNAGLGMAMFSLGLFMALQPRIIAGGNKMAAYAAVVRFIVGPAIMAAASAAVGVKGSLIKIAIIQATLPQGIVPFVFAKEYNVHPQILSTAYSFRQFYSNSCSLFL